MKTSQTFTILFWINKSRSANDLAELYARVTVNGKRTNIGLKRKVDIHLWDSINKKAKGNTREAKEINNYINLVQSRLFNIYQDLKYKGELITPQLVKMETPDIVYHPGRVKVTIAGRTKVIHPRRAKVDHL